MIEHAHGEHRVEALQPGRKLFQGQGQVPGRQVRQEALDRQELAEEQPVGIDTHHALGTGAEHAPLVVAIAAAHIQHPLAAQVEVRRDPCPFPVRAPFGVEVHAEQLEGPLAPGDQPLQGGLQRGTGGVVAGAVEGEAPGQFHTGRGQRGQGLHRRAPARQVTVADGQLGVELGGQVGGPVLQRVPISVCCRASRSSVRIMAGRSARRS